MNIWTWESEKIDEIKKRWTEWKCPEGITVRGACLDLTRNRFFCLYEVEDPKVLLAANDYWTDIAKVDSVPVMEAEEPMKLMSQA